MKHKIKGLSGSRPTVSFRCEHCHGGLVASLKEAGQSTDCPTCGATIAVPGERELAEWTRHRADEERAADQKKAERVARIARKQDEAASLRADAEADRLQRTAAAAGAGRPQRAAADATADSPAEHGSFSDRVLMVAFAFYRCISVVLICAATVVIVGGLVWLTISLPVHEEPPGPDEVAEVPDAGAFIVYCRKLEQEANRTRGQQSVGERGFTAQAASPAPRFRWPCSEVGDEILQVVQSMDLLPKEGGDYLCEWYQGLPVADRKQSWGGLVRFATAYGHQRAQLGQASEVWCSDLEALAWYVREDVRKRSDAADIQDGRLRENEQRAANRSWSIDMAGTLIVAAIASLMAFIALPLLIQIERNTRATPAAPQEPP
jgi:hypothetical protein